VASSSIIVRVAATEKEEEGKKKKKHRYEKKKKKKRVKEKGEEDAMSNGGILVHTAHTGINVACAGIVQWMIHSVWLLLHSHHTPKC